MAERRLNIEQQQHGYSARFHAMGSPCEVLCESNIAADVHDLSQIVAAEAWRIEDKFSRYLRGNVVFRLNNADAKPIDVDNETSKLIDFAALMHDLSGGLFDITSGVLRLAWSFDGSDNVPGRDTVADILKRVGWQKVSWRDPTFSMPAGMEIDFGGIGKEYAVDRATHVLRQASEIPCLVNFGGDLAVTRPPVRKNAWVVGVEGATDGAPDKLIEVRHGALATSGDSRRFLCKDGVRYSHVLDPRTGFPVVEAATSITVAADTCTQAGMISTLAMLKGPGAEEFLSSQSEQWWCRRS